MANYWETESLTSPDLTLPAIDKTMNVMKPGAQNLIKHAVRPSDNLTDAEDSQVRFSISFRKIIPIIEEEAQETLILRYQQLTKL